LKVKVYYLVCCLTSKGALWARPLQPRAALALAVEQGEGSEKQAKANL